MRPTCRARALALAGVFVLLATGCGTEPGEGADLSLRSQGGDAGAGADVVSDVCVGPGCSTRPCFGPECDSPEGCGDGVCSDEESKATCCTDCGCGPSYECEDNKCVFATSCGNGICEPGLGENCETCADCACPAGDVCIPAQELCCTPQCAGLECGSDGCGGSCGTCSAGTICVSGGCTGKLICGDGFCDAENGENCANCSAECECGDGELCMADGACCKPSCAGKHCGSDGCIGSCGECTGGTACIDDICVQQVGCGNGKCEPEGGETCASCLPDCGCKAGEKCTPLFVCCAPSCAGKVCGSDGCDGSCGACPPGQGCVAGACTEEIYCGNGKCEEGSGEHCGNCASDCKCVAGTLCIGKACCAPACTGKSCGSDGCGGTCGVCPPDEICEAGKCQKKGDCGNGKCEPSTGEGCGSCPADCACPAPKVCLSDGSCCAPSCGAGVECGSNGCGGSCGTCTGGKTCAAGKCVSTGQVCPAVGQKCEDHYPESKTCPATGATKTVQCHKYGSCTGVGGGEMCSFGAGSSCEDPCAGGPVGPGPPANKFGIGLVGPSSPAQLDAVKALVGAGGHVLLILPGVHKGKTGPDEAWKTGVKAAYDRDLVPVIRVQPGWGLMSVRNDSDDAQHKQYTTLAAAYKAVVKGLPMRDGWPLYVQVLNEPNLCYEWTCTGGGWLDGATRAAEYAAFFRDVADALHAIGDPRIKVSLGALAPGGVTKCECCGAGECGWEAGATGLSYLAWMQAAVPSIWSRLDFLATHSYPATNVGWGFWPPYDQSLVGLTYYESELAAIGKDLPVLITETGWSTKRPPGGPYPSEDQKAEYTKKAYQNVWLPSSKVKGVMPFVFQDGYWGDQEGFGWMHTNGTPFAVYGVIKAYRCALGFGPC